MHKLLILSMLFVAWSFQSAFSQTPAALNTSISYGPLGYTDVDDIQTAFNNARRSEEAQFCLANNSIADLLMPNQATWDNMSSDERFLFLMNAERTARGGLNYCQGVGPVLGLAFTGVESSIDAIAQAHADFLIATQSTGIQSQALVIDQDPNIGGSGCNTFKGIQPDCCHTFLPNSVGSGIFSSNATPADPSTIVTVGIEVQTVFFWVYGNNNNSGSDPGGSRNMVLLQDIKPGNTATDPCGFVNDYGDIEDEGFIGIGIAAGVPDPASGSSHIDLVILSFFDPISQTYGCNYDCTTCGTCPTTLVENAIPIQEGNYQALDWVRSAGTVQSPSVVAMTANNFVQLNPQFEVLKGAMFHAYIDGCYYTLN